MSRGRGFGVLWSANALSNLADGLAFVSMPLLAASMTDDPRLVAGLATLYALVRLLVALPIGVWVDRWDRRTLIVAANLLRGVALLVLALTVQFGVSSLVILYAAMAVVGTLESVADSAAVAMLPSLVDRKRLGSANGRVAAAQLICDEFAGPPLGGFLFALAAAAPVLAMGGLWAAAGLVALALPIRRSTQPHADAPPARPSVYAEAREGIAWFARHRVVGFLALIGALASVGYMLPFSILVLFAEERLGLDATGYGLLLAFSALGGLLGSFLAPRLRTWLGYRWTIVASLLLGALSLGGLAVTTDPILAGVLLALYILHAVVWSICALSLRQRLVPDALLGRVGGATRVLGLLGLAAGSALGGVLGAIDLTIPVAGGAVVFVGCYLLAAVTLRGELTPDDRSVVATREVDAATR
ncbi:MFS transporter [Microbacterium sp. zg-Y818]|uniref:MFS transporter n=1 Tax=unclassified Microbacterium TaxID=2609290 RepID=UPI00214B750F|nr:MULTISPECIES: MFS transporter [unclassified Microbacterium]MCR2799481.1 MFS transporter [Microbacterium sp. zg.Y818]WIM21478.1 MFS transporter [Microbacterium sp. zg-Y818]